ncbi:hypothetical protein JNB11_00035 [Kocuria palustris]|nr:hypothetical protein [Kocuria palustris]
MGFEDYLVVRSVYPTFSLVVYHVIATAVNLRNFEKIIGRLHEIMKIVGKMSKNIAVSLYDNDGYYGNGGDRQKRAI